MPDDVDIANDGWIHFKTTGRVSRNERRKQRNLAEQARQSEAKPEKLVQGWFLTIPTDWKLSEKPVKLFRRQAKRPWRQEGTMEEFRETFPEKYE